MGRWAVSMSFGTLAILMAFGSGESTPEAPAPAPEQAAPEQVAPEAPAKPARALPPLPGGGEGDHRPDDCTLDVAGLTPRLASEQAGGAKVTVTRDQDRLVEEFTLPDGTPVRSTYFGCYHVNITETYVLEATPEDRMAAIKAVMGQVKRVEGDEDALIRATKNAGPVGEGGVFECGEFNTCQLTGDGPVVEISWSFAM